jgi:D-serine deaminase-like pyridoxal phosphate-dependent protein
MPLITQTATTHDFVSLPSKDKLCQAFIGKPLSSLRTPAAIIDRSVFQNNCLSMANKVESHGLRFRAHVKTHKTVEGVEMQLKALGTKDKSVVCSTLMECWKIAESRLVRDGIVNDVSIVSSFTCLRLERLFRNARTRR